MSILSARLSAAAIAAAATIAPAAQAADLVPISLPAGADIETMFRHADIVVQMVMGGLLLASVLTWTVWLVKSVELYAARRRLANDLRRLSGSAELHQAIALSQAGGQGIDATAQALLAAAAEEWDLSAGLRDDRDGVKERIASHLERIEAASSRRMTRGTGLLATIGSTAPFVGLFGTVWGIMNSFLGIASTHTTNLAVVAPGIAEALLATACGLFAAIPAVVIYNHFARQVAGYRAQVGDAAALVLRLVSRELSREALSLAKEK